MTTSQPGTRIFVFVTRGDATKVALVFEPGRPVPPFSVGSRGEWRILADGVARVHFYLGFDGEALFGAALAGTSPVCVAGEPISSTLTKLPAQCEVSFGSAAIALTNASTYATSSPRPRARRADPRGPRITDPFARATIVESLPSPVASADLTALDDLLELPTRVYRADEIAQLMPDQSEFAERAPARTELAAQSVVSPTTDFVGLDELLALPRTEEQSGESALAETIVMPVASPAMVLTATTDAPTEKRLAKRTLSPIPMVPIRRKAIAGLLMAAVIVIGARTFAKRERTDAGGPVAVPSATSGVQKEQDGKSGAASDRSPRASTSSGRTARDAPLGGDPVMARDGKTPERQAVDLIASGSYGEAAALYERLALQTQNTLFADAARIARLKEQGR